MELHRSYQHAGIYDGLQWHLAIKQGEREKSVYCSNHFPEQLVSFAHQLDTILSAYERDLSWRLIEGP